MTNFIINPEFLMYEWGGNLPQLGGFLELENEEGFSIRKVKVCSIWETPNHNYYYTEDVLDDIDII